MFLGCSPCCGGSCPDWSDIVSCTLGGQASYGRSPVTQGATNLPALGNSAGFDLTIPFFETTGGGLRASHSDDATWEDGNFFEIFLRNWFSGFPEDRYIDFYVTMGFMGRFGFGYYPCGLPTLAIEPGNPNPVRDLTRDLGKQYAAFSLYDGYFESFACTLSSYDFDITSNFTHAGSKANLGTRTTGLGGSCPDSFVSSTYFSGPVVNGSAALPLALSATAEILTPDGDSYSVFWTLSFYKFVFTASDGSALPALPNWFSSFAT